MEKSFLYWFIPLFPTVLKRLMIWSGTNYADNPMWTFICWAELFAIFIGVLSAGVALGWLMSDRDQRNFDQLKSEHLDRIYSNYKEFESKLLPLEKKISALETNLHHEKWKSQQFANALEAERKRHTRTAAEANQEALKELV